MKLFISTPCFGGQLTKDYVASMNVCIAQAAMDGILTDWQIHYQGTESLIPRGRDRSANMFLELGFDKLLSIDADISWTYDDFKRIITSDKDIVGGTYPLKCFPLVANFNPLHERGTEFISTHRGFDLNAFESFIEKYANPKTGEAEVRHVPTGFLCVTKKVIDTLAKTVPVYWQFQPDTGERKGFFQFYPSGVFNNEYESEDWGFCRLATEAGFKVHLNTKVRLGHAGNHTYRMGQFFGEQSSNFPPAFVSSSAP